MKNILITGAAGFLGRNLAAHLAPREDVGLRLFDLENSEAELRVVRVHSGHDRAGRNDVMPSGTRWFDGFGRGPE